MPSVWVKWVILIVIGEYIYTYYFDAPWCTVTRSGDCQCFIVCICGYFTHFNVEQELFQQWSFVLMDWFIKLENITRKLSISIWKKKRVMLWQSSCFLSHKEKASLASFIHTSCSILISAFPLTLPSFFSNLH